MRILVVSNLFPPHHIGGYELRCSQVAHALAARGEDVLVVTSEVALAEEPATGFDRAAFPVKRFLGHYRLQPPSGRPLTLTYARRQLEDVRRFSAILEDFAPDVVAWWNMEGLTKAILPLPATRSVPDVCFVEDRWMVTEFGRVGEADAFHWFDFWRGDWGPKWLRPIIRRGVKRWEKRFGDEKLLARPFRLDPSLVCFVSEFLQREHEVAGLGLSSTRVIYGCVPAERFYHKREASEFAADPLALLYVGYLSRDRGLHTLIEALGNLPPTSRERVRLSIAYGGPVHETAYSRELKNRLDELGLSQHVRFMPRVPHETMPALYRAHQLLIVPSTRGEGLPMTMMEAAASGAAVITTGSGGAIELADQAGMPLFPKDHPVALSRLLRRLMEGRQRLADIAARGQRVVMERFTFDRMMTDIRQALATLAESRSRSSTARSHGATPVSDRSDS